MGATFSDRLRLALDAMGMKPADLARAVKVNPATITLWMQGRTDAKKIRADTMQRVARELNRRVDWLVHGRGPEPAGDEPDLRTKIGEIDFELEATGELVRFLALALSETTPSAIVELRQAVHRKLDRSPKHRVFEAFLRYLDGLSDHSSSSAPRESARSSRKKGSA